ncbi:hypothetical protein SAPIO_CDS10533 [Scedosporium apiospermum]|uniref:Uncharacterized protein n=1 Tax=Pseudallescheria apiosperma TaxID=563466 RepID=A0A084FVM3_PSEDA|nr:uncharacterized protein SAPIO_CDS10533 [Scedosporium apiospermum]KEZ39135.1 hypothetical protein SAPIO_CDS10533 [Scedosporium apiospermum]
MVSIKAIYTALVLPVLMVTAAPVDDLPIAKDGTDISPLAVKASITYCEHTNWNGQCETRLQPLTECYNLPSSWNDRISSIRNDSRSSYKCTWYEHGNCQGRSYDNQNDANLADGDGFFNDRISSWSCKYK